MQNIEDLTIRDAEIRAGVSITEEELDRSEQALFKLLQSYSEQELKEELRLLMNELSEKYPADKFIILNDELMRPAELYKVIDASNTLLSFLMERKKNRLKRRAQNGDQDAIWELHNIFD